MFQVLLSNWKIENLSFEEIVKNSKTILYFYPKDNTPGCNIQAVDFTKFKKDFEKLGYQIFWVSKDKIESHEKFQKSKSLWINLISDSELILHNQFETFGEKKSFWKIVNWTIRSTFVLDKWWNIIKKYRNVKAKWHAEKLLEELQKL